MTASSPASCRIRWRLAAFQTFIKGCEDRSEPCKSFGVFGRILQTILSVAAADQDGNFGLHSAQCQGSVAIFWKFGTLNCLWYWPWYLTKIEVLEVEHPRLYQCFAKWQWVAKERAGAFSAVAPEMKQEQTTRRSVRGPVGYYAVDNSRNIGCLAEFELLIQELVAISNLRR